MTFVSSTLLHQIVQLTPMSTTNRFGAANVVDHVFSKANLNMVQGLALTDDSIYTTSAYMGNSMVRLNRTTGTVIARFQDDELSEPTDVKLYGGHLYTCDKSQVRKYNRYNGEYLNTHIDLETAHFSSMIFHHTWNEV